MYKIGWFSTGRDKAARDLLDAVMDNIKNGSITAEISFVFCSREPGESEQSDLFIEKVRSYRIPIKYFSYARYKAAHGEKSTGITSNLEKWRLDYDRQVMSLIGEYDIDLCVLAGYMLIVGYEMCNRYTMINLHPAAPGGPTGSWQQVIWQLIKERDKESGVMMHLVTPELDRGPVATYCTFSIRGEGLDEYWRMLKGTSIGKIKDEQGETSPLFRLIREEGLKREFPLIIATIRAFSDGKIKVTNGKIKDDSGRIIKGYNLTDEVESQLKTGKK